jgi:hypothetical protein
LSGARVEQSFEVAKPPAENIVQTGTPNERTTQAKAFDPTIERLTPLDVELMRRGQLRANAATTAHMGEEVETALKARASYLVMSGQAMTQGQGLGYQPNAWAKLREAELKHVMSRDLGIKTSGHLSYGQAEGFVEGHVYTSLGKHAIINRGMGYAAMAVQPGQELAIGQAVGRAMGVER